MTLKAELHDLLDKAADRLGKEEALAMSERIRVHDALAAAKGAVESMLHHEAPAEPAKPAAKAKAAAKAAE